MAIIRNARSGLLFLLLFLVLPCRTAYPLTDGYALEKTAQTAGGGKGGAYRELGWEELAPLSWDPTEAFAGLNIDEMEDDDPRVGEAMEIFLQRWNQAPANPEMHGQIVKLAGYVAPLDYDGAAELKEFLLVPYFGACIHVPPPPANQIVYIRLDRALQGVESMDAVWVYGEILLEEKDTDMGNAGYSMNVDKVELYW
jgi:hypothetical protein